MFLPMQHFCFLDLSKKKVGSILIFGNLRFNIVVRINHDNVASRGADGRTLTIVRLETRIRRKDGTENFGGFVYVLDLHNGISRCGFLVCSINFGVSLFSGYLAEGYHAPPLSFPATAPRANKPVQMHSS